MDRVHIYALISLDTCFDGSTFCDVELFASMDAALVNLEDGYQILMDEIAEGYDEVKSAYYDDKGGKVVTNNFTREWTIVEREVNH